jgi:cysteinyl-tRNA synthetase
MSKSLKNFITIRQALEVYSPRQIRFCFLMHKYNAPMDYGDNTMSQAASIEKIFSEYFHNVKAVLRRLGVSGSQYMGTKELALVAFLETSKSSVKRALMDDFDTPVAISALLELIRESNRYTDGDGSTVSTIVLSSVARYITYILKVFGCANDAVEIGFPLDGNGGLGGGAEGGGSVSREAVLGPLLDVLTKFRESVRLAAMGKDSAAVLAAADTLRDLVLPDLGVRMEDKGSGADVVTVWKLEDPEVLRKERVLKEEAKLAKELQKQEALRKQKEKDEKARIPPESMFLDQVELYSAFDATGLPTHDKAGEPLSKGAMKKLQKDMAKQKELHEKYMAKQSGGAGEGAVVSNGENAPKAGAEADSGADA